MRTTKDVVDEIYNIFNECEDDQSIRDNLMDLIDCQSTVDALVDKCAALSCNDFITLMDKIRAKRCADCKCEADCPCWE